MHDHMQHRMIMLCNIGILHNIYLRNTLLIGQGLRDRREVGCRLMVLLLNVSEVASVE